MQARKLKVALGPAQETLLIPLYGRAVETKKRSGLIDDPRSVEMVTRIEYDFAKWDGGLSLPGTALRTRMFDQDVLAFLAENPTGTIVELGSGLNTRFERIDNGAAQWFDLDLPDAIALRREFFPETPRRTMLACNIGDSTWTEQVKRAAGPYCFISEGVLMYLESSAAEMTVARLAAEFPGCWLILDTTPRCIVERQHKHDAMRHLPRASWFRWACDDPRQLERLGFRVVRSRSFLDADPEFIRCMPWSIRLLTRWFSWLPLQSIRGYRMSRMVAWTD